MIGCRDKVGLLVDVAHLKVSANTLNFKPEQYLLKLNKYIKAYHLSDNNGLADENKISQTKVGFEIYKDDAEFCTLELRKSKFKKCKRTIKLS